MADRLNKVIAASGIASRRKADDLIKAGKVHINGSPVTRLGTLVQPGDSVFVDGKPLPQPERITYAIYKPRGVVTSRSHQGNDKIVTDLIPKNPSVYPVGRLDKDSEGLLLLTNDGALADRLTHPKFEHTKVYKVLGRQSGTINVLSIRDKLLKGVRLGDGIAKADHVTVSLEKDGILVLVITVHEGRHHLIRRMCASINITVNQLIRTQVSNLKLGELKPGMSRVLTSTDLKLLV
jgi:23S rRNA pseudouridine2605 synthase